MIFGVVIFEGGGLVPNLGSWNIILLKSSLWPFGQHELLKTVQEAQWLNDQSIMLVHIPEISLESSREELLGQQVIDYMKRVIGAYIPPILLADPICK